ncbi:MAG: ABC transporter ATP-binding protein [Lewinellaceae bacterium]|nr:ABC transporter ATP-binding protein [Lewinellaceae bacterium]
MNIQLTNAGKRFRFDWIFKNLNFHFQSGTAYALQGPNGSGKSTLMKILSGHLSLSKGQIAFTENDRKIDGDAVYQKVSFAAPYIELIEEFTLEEALRFHSQLKPLLPEYSPERLYELLELPRTRLKEIRYFSSGMKQRVKLALAICSDTPVLLLDEPSTNLDANAVRWFKMLLERHSAGRLVVIASNDPADLESCREGLNMLEL